MALVVFEENETIETGITDATIERTDPGLKNDGEIEPDPESGPKSPAGSGAVREKEEDEDTKMASEMEQEIGETETGAGVGRSTDHGEVRSLHLAQTSTANPNQCCR